MKSMVRPERVGKLNNISYKGGPVVYWMSREQRVCDNWALLYAQELSQRFETSFAVVFALTPDFLGATQRQYDFMLRGLTEVESELRKLNIPFFLLEADPGEIIIQFVRKANAGALVTDFSPLKIKQTWNSAILKSIEMPFYEVDAHNIVPCRKVSDKQEYAAYTIRPKINRLLDSFLDEFPRLKKQKQSFPVNSPRIDWVGINKRLRIDKSIKPVDWCVPGHLAGTEKLRSFINGKLGLYAEKRNDPTMNCQSGLSPYLHFGQISAQRIALTISSSNATRKSKEAFMEELIIRRELADNFCLYNGKYDKVQGFPLWARTTLDSHLNDKREYLYSMDRLESADTHDRLWNAAQRQVVISGTMPGYLRMYWAKKILEWSESPEKAMKAAIYLNDRYQLDGRDPNGYAGIAWSIGGVHDRPWAERPVYGKIRYMSYSGCKRKFDIEKYIAMNG